jgi:hypothetical protein
MAWPDSGLAEQRGPKCARRHAHRSPEHGDEMCRSRKAGGIGHLGHGLARPLEQRDRPLEPAAHEVAMRRHWSLALFETVVNIIHKAAPSAAIAFNTRPEDTARQLDAVK